MRATERDKGYDDGKLLERLWDEHEINLVIDIHNLWQDGEGDEAGAITKLVAGQQNVLYTFGGQVSCMCLESGKVCSMDYAGFERTRNTCNTLKYRYPVLAGEECQSQGKCPVGKAIRIPLAEDRRVFTPVARSSYVWQDYYDHLAGSFGFEHPFIRGLAKMRLRVTMALTVMLAMALGRIQAGQPEHLRSLVKSR